MSPWRWWVGFDEDGEPETYNIGEVGSRVQAIALGQRETRAGDRFWIIEARSSEDMRHEGADSVPFLRKRNRESFVNGPTAAGAESAGG
ncbi:hypothetical protein [Sphingomonas sp. MMS24-J13]|uniref:hypothetical protein n=1 Tax=Sphingomonas sp. MMS24-J13 TaxID=3238686 RepID=UPI00384FAF66